MLDFPTAINTEQLLQSLILHQVLESLNDEDKTLLEMQLSEALLWEIINSLEPIEE